MKKLGLVVSHLLVLLAGFALGIYLLPILTAPASPTVEQVKSAGAAAQYRAQFRRELKGSDPLHWGDGIVTVGPESIALLGSVAPGPAYKLYLVPNFVETKVDFERLEPQSLAIADVRTFENFIVPIPKGTDLAKYDTVVVWCEAFSQFITAAKYR